MSENSSKKTVFVWDEAKLKIAEAVAKGDRPLKDILTEFKINERMFYRWKKHPDFQRKIDEIIQDIDVAQKSERIKIAKKEIKRILARLEYNEDKPCSRDLITALKYVGEEMGDFSEHKDINIHGIIQAPDLRRILQEKLLEEDNTLP